MTLKKRERTEVDMSERRAVYAIFDGLIHATIWGYDSEHGRCHEFTLGRTDGIGDHFRQATTFHEQEAEAVMRVIERAVSVIRHWTERGESFSTESVRADCTEWAASRYRSLIQITGWEVYYPASADQTQPEWGTYVLSPARRKKNKG